MKLISENQNEDCLIPRLTALLCDLDVYVDGYLSEDAIAATSISVQDLELEMFADAYITQEDLITLLQSIEGSISAAMREAGMKIIEEAISHAQRGHAHLNSRILGR